MTKIKMLDIWKEKGTFHSDGNDNDYVFDRSWYKIWGKTHKNVKKKVQTEKVS